MPEIKPQDHSLERLKARPQFLSVARGRRYATPGLVLQARKRPVPDQDSGRETVGYGITATKKIGNAVIRNKAKRRLRAAARELLPKAGRPGFDYVLIGRAATKTRPWQSLLDDLSLALQMVHQPRAKNRRSKPAAKSASSKQSGKSPQQT